MARPKTGYILADGTRVPGVTTIISRFKESGGLIAWAWDLGMQGLDYREVRDAAASSGTLAHEMIEAFLHKKDPQESLKDVSAELASKARKGFEAFEEWAKRSKMEVVATEEPLVSEKYRFGGTPDAIILVDGKLSVGDWKTANRLYPDNLLQLAAYKVLWEENHPKDTIESFDIMRFSKEEADFVHAHFGQLDDAWRMFVLYREAYELDKVLKKRV